LQESFVDLEARSKKCEASKMKRESARFSQQAINRIAQIAIASRLKQDVEISVDIATTLSQLTKGQIDAIEILIRRLVLSEKLRTEEFQLNIGAVTVKPLSAMKGQIKLLHPSEGKLRIVIHEADLATALYQSIQSNSVRSSQAISGVQCTLADGAITIRCSLDELSDNSESDDAESTVFTVVPQLEQEAERRIIWQPLLSSNFTYSEWVSDLLSKLDRLLSLKDFEQKGLFLTPQEIKISDGILQLNADALIQEFPPD
jgi:hypothetical protein